MKKFLALILTLTLIFTLAACSGKTETKDKDKAEKTEEKDNKKEDEKEDKTNKDEVIDLLKSLAEEEVPEGVCYLCEGESENGSIICDECAKLEKCYFCEKGLADDEYAMCNDCVESFNGLFDGTEDIEDDFDVEDDYDIEDDFENTAEECAVCGSALSEDEFYMCTACTERTTCYYCEEELSEDDSAYHYECWEENLWFGDSEGEDIYADVCEYCGSELTEDEYYYCTACAESTTCVYCGEDLGEDDEIYHIDCWLENY